MFRLFTNTQREGRREGSRRESINHPGTMLIREAGAEPKVPILMMINFQTTTTTTPPTHTHSPERND